MYIRLQCTKLFWTAGPRPVEIAMVQSIPVAVGPLCPVGKALAVRYRLYFILTLVPGIKISIYGFPVDVFNVLLLDIFLVYNFLNVHHRVFLI